MGNRTQAHGIWAMAVLALLLVGLLPRLPGLDHLGAALAPASAAATPTPVAGTFVSDEAQAAYALEARTIEIYEDAAPSVVNVTNRSYVTYGRFGMVPEEGTGSGFIYDHEGHIVTNYHVVENAEELLVTLANGQVYQAEIVGTDPTNDLAAIQIEAGNDLPEPLLLADSDELRVGQFVVAIGNPYGLQQTLTTGVVSALGRVIESPEYNRFIGEAIQTDAAINPGNSGGPMLDLSGRVIGVNSQIISPSGASAGIGFAVSANTVQRVVPELIARGYFAHPWIGLDTLPLTQGVAQLLRQAGVEISADAGLLVLETTPGGPAEQAGIRGGDRWVAISRRTRLPVGGDIITAIDGLPTHDQQALALYLEGETTIGATVELTIIRRGEVQTVPVVLGELPN
jgi:S1-C subfamily serine protease